VAPRTRPRLAPTDDWQQIQLLTRFPEQLTYELIRPVVLFGQSGAERAQVTGTPQRTLYRQAACFEHEGMASLFTPAPARHQHVPAEIREAITTLKAEYPPLGPHELATICEVRFGDRPDSRTVRRLLADTPSLPTVNRRYPPYHQIADPAAVDCRGRARAGRQVTHAQHRPQIDLTDTVFAGMRLIIQSPDALVDPASQGDVYRFAADVEVARNAPLVPALTMEPNDGQAPFRWIRHLVVGHETTP
jgi:hypothetical protein